MRKNLKRKISREFLKKNFPENLLPHKKLISKDKRRIQEKIVIFKRIKRRIRKVDDFLQRKYNGLQLEHNFEKKRPLMRNQKKKKFLFSVDQIKNDLLGVQERNQPASDFLSKIKEKKKISVIYGHVSKKNFQRAYDFALHTQGRVNDNLILYFENRLDTILYRINFAKTMQASRQLINHNLVIVNGVQVNIPTYQVKPGDIITINSKKKTTIANQTLRNLKNVVKNRRFRFLISLKTLEKKLGSNLYSLNSSEMWYENIKKKKNPTNKPKRKKNNNIFSFNYEIRKLVNKVKNWLNQTERSNNKKRVWFLETMIRLNNVKNIVETTNSILTAKGENYKNQSLILKEKVRKKIVALALKKLMYRKPPRYLKKFSFRISSMKAINVEVSYKTLSAIILYSPQKIAYPALINVDMFSRSLSKK